MSTATELVVKLTAETAQFRREIEAAHGTTKKLEKGFGDVGNRMTKMGEEIKSAVLAYASFEGAKKLVQAVVEETMQAEEATARLEAVLSATGHQAGLTAASIDDLAQAMERNTLFDAEDVKNAAAALATFDNVNGQTFRTAIKLSGDLASVMGGDLQSNAVKLGKMLEMPLENIDALSKAGVKFDDVEKAHIKTLLEHNQLAEAQAAVLQKVTEKVGGTAEAIIGSGGLTPAANGLKDAWKELLEEMGKTPAGSDAGSFAGGLKATLEGTADELRFIKGFFESIDPHSMEGLTRELAKQQELLAANANTGFGGIQMTPKERAENKAAIEERIALIQQEMHALDVADEHAAAREHVGTGPATAIDTPEAIAARKAAAEKRIKEAKDLAKKLEEIDRESAAHMRAGIVGLNAAFKKRGDADIDAWKDHLEVMKDLQDASDAVDQARLDARVTDQAKAAEQVQKVWNHAVQNISDEFADVITDTLTGQIRSFRDFFREILTVWAATMAQMAGATAATKLFGGFLGSLGGGLTLPNAGPAHPFPGLPSSTTVNINVAGTNATPSQIAGAVVSALNSRGMSGAVNRRLAA